jgi:hypothetical protein
VRHRLRQRGSGHRQGPGLGRAPGSAAPVEKTVTVTITTKPPGARILINGQELSEKTGEAFELKQSTHEVRVTLQLEKYEDIVIPLKPEGTKINLEKTFKRKSSGTVIRPGSDRTTPGKDRIG